MFDDLDNIEGELLELDEDKLSGSGRHATHTPVSTMGTHPLSSTWTIWRFGFISGSKPHGHPEAQSEAAGSDTWESQLRRVDSFSTVETFWQMFRRMQPPYSIPSWVVDKTPSGCTYYYFRDGIRPMWEDAANESGGKWTCSLTRSQRPLYDALWEKLVMAVVGGALEKDNPTETVVGIVFSRRTSGARLSVWNRDCRDQAAVDLLGNRLRDLFKPLIKASMEYVAHRDHVHARKT